MEFLVEFESHIPPGTPADEIQPRYSAEAAGSAELAREGHLFRLWRRPVAHGQRTALGLYRAANPAQLNDILGGLPVHD
jgi:muconolactone D-isomerase